MFAIQQVDFKIICIQLVTQIGMFNKKPIMLVQYRSLFAHRARYWWCGVYNTFLGNLLQFTDLYTHIPRFAN